MKCDAKVTKQWGQLPEIFFSNLVTLCVMLSWPLVDSDKGGKNTGDLEKQERVTIQGGDGKESNFRFYGQCDKNYNSLKYIMVFWPFGEQ